LEILKEIYHLFKNGGINVVQLKKLKNLPVAFGQQAMET
jgi:hypothetical protein